VILILCYCRIIVSATQFVIDLDLTLKTNSNTAAIWQRMLELESNIEPLTNKADTWLLNSFPPVKLDMSELKVAQALRGIARIKLNSARIKIHRYCAFSDLPVFTKKHCDLKSISDTPVSDPASPMAPNCGCSSTFHELPNVMDLTITQSARPDCGILPFSANFSAKVCLKASFAIAQSFSSLPFPQPLRASDPISYFPPAKSNTSPRMIPVFACCAMQAAYAMIMLSYKTHAMGFSANGKAATQLLGQLESGLQMVLNALKNYSMAYEAIGGQRGILPCIRCSTQLLTGISDQVQMAADSMNMMENNTIFEEQITL